MGNRGIVIEGDQGVSNDSIGLCIDNRNVGDSGVRCADSDCHIDLLAGSVGLDVGRIVTELVTLAQPDIASCGIVVLLRICNLEDSLDVTQGVAGLVVVDSIYGLG